MFGINLALVICYVDVQARVVTSRFILNDSEVDVHKLRKVGIFELHPTLLQKKKCFSMEINATVELAESSTCASFDWILVLY